MEERTQTKPPLWTKSFILACLANLMIFTSMNCLLPTLPVFATEILNSDASNVGYIFGTFALAAVIARPWAGYFIDTLGRRPVLFTAMSALVMALAAYNLAATMIMLLAVRAFHGFCWGFSSTAAGTVATDIVPAARRGEGIGYYGMAIPFAMAVGPIIGLEVLKVAGFSGLFNTSFAITVLGFMCLLGVKYQSHTRERAKSKMNFASLLEPRVFVDAWITFFTALLYGGIIAFVILLGKDIGVANGGSYFLAYASTLVLSRPYAGRAYDQHGPVRIMTCGFVAIALGFFLLYLAQGLELFLASALFMGVGYGVVQSTTMAMAINKVEPYRRGAANSTIFMSFDLGLGLGSILLGIFSKYYGLSYMYLLSCAIVLIPALIFYGYYVKTGEKAASCDSRCS